MQKFNFLNDYHDGGHPRILSALQAHPAQSSATYGEDIYTKKAIDSIRNEIKNPIADVHFVTGGTRSEEHTSELQSRGHLVCRLLLEKKNETVRQIARQE